MRFGYVEVATRAKHRCEYCHAPEALVNFPFFVEHILPRARAPELIEAPENLALACPPCNLHKADRIDAIDAETGETARLFNPRRDTWSEHFSWADDGITLQGLTTIGRATIAALHMNSVAQRGARKFWLTSDLFP